MTQTPETSPDGVDVDSQFLDEVSQLSNMTKSELAGRFAFIFRFLSLFSYSFYHYLAKLTRS